MTLNYGGILKGHRGWVTAVAVPASGDGTVKLISASRDNTLVNWHEAVAHSIDDASAKPRKRLEGHSNFVSDVAISNSGEFAVSASWDHSLRLWNTETGEATKFLGHKGDVTGVAFSSDNRQIVSVSRDKSLRVWNVRGDCVTEISKDGPDQHTDWISTVRFSPSTHAALLVTGSWDSTVKVWDSNYKVQYTLRGHTGAVNSVAVSPDGSLCASAGKDGKVKLWDLTRGDHLYELDCKEPINQICFSPNRYWLVAATETRIKIFDLENKNPIAELIPEVDEGVKSKPQCISITWSVDGAVLFSGYTDNAIRVWKVVDNQ